MNRIKKVLFVFLALIAPAFSYAQEVLYSQYDKFDYRNDGYGVVGMCGKNLYTYLRNGSEAKLFAYDDSMNKVATVMLDFFPERIYQAKFIAYPDKMIALYQALESNKVVQYAALLDPQGRLKCKPVQLGQIKTGIFGATRNYFSYAISDNKKSLFIYSAIDKNRSIELEGKWVDDNLNIIKRSTTTFETDNAPEHGDINVGNDGTVYMAAYTPTGSFNYADQYWMLILPQGATKFTAKELPLGEKYAAGGYMKLDNNNNRLYFGGFYADRKNGGFDGIIYAAYDVVAGNFQSSNFIPFDQSLISAAGARHKAHTFDNYRTMQLIVKNDGGFVMISEMQYITTRNNSMPGFGPYSFYGPSLSSVTHEYHYNDIMALSYDKAGAREWSAFIPKDQYSQEDDGIFSSYALLNTGGAIAFLFNDFNPSHSRIQLATLESDGKTDIHSFAAEGNDNPDWLPRIGKQVAGRVLIVPCLRKKQICFAKVIF